MHIFRVLKKTANYFNILKNSWPLKNHKHIDRDALFAFCLLPSAPTWFGMALHPNLSRTVTSEKTVPSVRHWEHVRRPVLARAAPATKGQVHRRQQHWPGRWGETATHRCIPRRRDALQANAIYKQWPLLKQCDQTKELRGNQNKHFLTCSDSTIMFLQAWTFRK